MSKLKWIFLVGLIFCQPLAAKESGRILALGDSLTFGYEVDDEHTWPSLLGKKLNKTIVNGGTSGATTAFGVPTLKFHLKRYRPEMVLYALGANDALRGIPPATTETNIRQAVELLVKEKIPVVIFGMKAPPNYGIKFPKEFEGIYPRVAKQYNVPLYPFLLEGVAGDSKLNQPDGIHPNKDGYVVVTENLYQFLKSIENDKQSNPPNSKPQ